MSRSAFFWFFVPFFSLVPFVFSRSLDQSFELPKFIAFLLLSAIFFLGFLATRIHFNFLSSRGSPKGMRGRNKFLRFFMYAGITTLFISTYFSVAPQMSFWGGSSHHQGVLFFLTLFFISGITFFFRPSKKEVLFFWVLPLAFCAGIEALVSIGQFFIPNFLFPDYVNYDAGARSFGTFGQPNSLARFLTFCFLLLLPLGALLFEKSLQKNEHVFFLNPQLNPTFSLDTSIPKFLKIGFLCLLPFLFFGILATESRASQLSLAVGIVLFLMFQKNSYMKILGGIGAFFISLVIFLFFTTSFLSSFLPESILRSESIYTRVELWKATPHLISQSPYYGYGLETFPEVFPPYMPEKLVNEVNQNQVPDRSHNEVMDFMVHIGIPGTLFLLAMLILILWKGIKRATHDPFYLGIFLAIISGIIARQFEFGTTVDYMLFAFFVPLFFLEKNTTEEVCNSEEKLLYSITYWIQAIPLAFWSIFLFLAGINFWQADAAYDNAMEKSQIITSLQNNPKLTPHQKAQQTEGFQKTILNDLYVAHKSMPWEAKYGLIYADRMVLEKKYKESEEALEIIFKNHPVYADVYFIAARLAWVQGENEKANKLFTIATSLAPARPVFWHEWGKFLEYIGDIEGAEEKWKREAEIFNTS